MIIRMRERIVFQFLQKTKGQSNPFSPSSISKVLFTRIFSEKLYESFIVLANRKTNLNLGI